ncbi:LysR family transcriptional regulator [Caenimonas sedimenti]|uniref:LysR family transcriptional regulator n=1 Tax=Caenimonas sedimenti TaxID=2596921 RepID=A0A562ZFS1_9BURK|nr:LysR family transcriptional regulator [Caenimonas sedimenti]TWO66026.1 LysR family transcriptional regulator [Caenimonas sedimenti]
MPRQSPPATEPAWAPTLRQLEVLRAVVQLGSLSRAAEALHVSQPSVTQTVSQLQRGCGVELLTHRHGRVAATAAAHSLLADIDEVFGAMERVGARLDALRSPAKGELKVACLHALATAVLPEAVGQFRATFPTIRLTLMVESSRSIRDALVAGKVDFAVLSDEADLAGLSTSMFYEVTAVCAMPVSHRLARRSVLAPVDLADEAVIGLSPLDPACAHMKRSFVEAGVAWQPAITTPYSLTQCELALAGAGIAITNPVVARKFQQQGLASVPFEPAVPFRSCLAFGSGYRASRASQAFIGLLRSQTAKRMAGPP